MKRIGYSLLGVLVLLASAIEGSSAELVFLPDPGCREKHLKIVAKSPWGSLMKKPTQQDILNARIKDQEHLKRVKWEFAVLVQDLKSAGMARVSQIQPKMSGIIMDILPLGGKDGRKYAKSLLQTHENWMLLWKKQIPEGDPSRRNLDRAYKYETNTLFGLWGKTILGEGQAGCFDKGAMENVVLRLAHGPAKDRSAYYELILSKFSPKNRLYLWNYYVSTLQQLVQRGTYLPNLEEIKRFFNAVRPPGEK